MRVWAFVRPAKIGIDAWGFLPRPQVRASHNVTMCSPEHNAGVKVMSTAHAKARTSAANAPDSVWSRSSLMANFGFPVPSESEAAIDADAVAAVRCALAMGDKMRELNTSWEARGLRRGRCRVGICTGPAVVGCVGADRSLKYTSVGDTVNTAARLESFDKEQFISEAPGVISRVLVSEETWRRSRDEFEIVDLGAHALKGKQAPVKIYRVMGLAKD